MRSSKLELRNSKLEIRKPDFKKVILLFEDLILRTLKKKGCWVKFEIRNRIKKIILSFKDLILKT